MSGLVESLKTFEEGLRADKLKNEETIAIYKLIFLGAYIQSLMDYEAFGSMPAAAKNFQLESDLKTGKRLKGEFLAEIQKLQEQRNANNEKTKT